MVLLFSSGSCPLITMLYTAGKHMAFFQQSISVLSTLVIALGAALGVWGGINLLEGYGSDNPGANAHVR